jgi:alkylated DNA repair dioxygenase AlkB
MTDLFHDAGPRRLELQGADVVLHPSPDLGIDPTEIFHRLKQETPWEQRSVRIHGREIPQPRLVSWHGDVAYAYSGLKLAPNPWTPILTALRDRVAAITGSDYNSVLLNAYRHGRDSIGMHADDEPELGPRPTIASISLGVERIFDLRRKDKSGRTVHVPLTHGSLLVMAGDTQRNWLHGIAKTSEPTGERINLTFRLTRGR